MPQPFLPQPFLDHILVNFGTAAGKILDLISLILVPDLITFLTFLETAGGQILYGDPIILKTLLGEEVCGRIGTPELGHFSDFWKGHKIC